MKPQFLTKEILENIDTLTDECNCILNDPETEFEIKNKNNRILNLLTRIELATKELQTELNTF